MAKEIWKFNDFSGGLSNYSNPKDINSNEFQHLENIAVDQLGVLKTLGIAEKNENFVPETSIYGDIIPGEGLASFFSDYTFTPGGAQHARIRVNHEEYYTPGEPCHVAFDPLSLLWLFKDDKDVSKAVDGNLHKKSQTIKSGQLKIQLKVNGVAIMDPLIVREGSLANGFRLTGGTGDADGIDKFRDFTWWNYCTQPPQTPDGESGPINNVYSTIPMSNSSDPTPSDGYDYNFPAHDGQIGLWPGHQMNYQGSPVYSMKAGITGGYFTPYPYPWDSPYYVHIAYTFKEKIFGVYPCGTNVDWHDYTMPDYQGDNWADANLHSPSTDIDAETIMEELYTGLSGAGGQRRPHTYFGKDMYIADNSTSFYQNSSVPNLSRYFADEVEWDFFVARGHNAPCQSTTGSLIMLNNIGQDLPGPSHDKKPIWGYNAGLNGEGAIGEPIVRYFWQENPSPYYFTFFDHRGGNSTGSNPDVGGEYLVKSAQGVDWYETKDSHYAVDYAVWNDSRFVHGYSNSPFARSAIGFHMFSGFNNDGGNLRKNHKYVSRKHINKNRKPYDSDLWQDTQDYRYPASGALYTYPGTHDSQNGDAGPEGDVPYKITSEINFPQPHLANFKEMCDWYVDNNNENFIPSKSLWERSSAKLVKLSLLMHICKAINDYPGSDSTDKYEAYFANFDYEKVYGDPEQGYNEIKHFTNYINDYLIIRSQEFDMGSLNGKQLTVHCTGANLKNASGSGNDLLVPERTWFPMLGKQWYTDGTAVDSRNYYSDDYWGTDTGKVWGVTRAVERVVDNYYGYDVESAGDNTSEEGVITQGPYASQTINWRAYWPSNTVAADALTASVKKLFVYTPFSNYANGGVSDGALCITKEFWLRTRVGEKFKINSEVFLVVDKQGPVHGINYDHQILNHVYPLILNNDSLSRGFYLEVRRAQYDESTGSNTTAASHAAGSIIHKYGYHPISEDGNEWVHWCPENTGEITETMKDDWENAKYRDYGSGFFNRQSRLMSGGVSTTKDKWKLDFLGVEYSGDLFNIIIKNGNTAGSGVIYGSGTQGLTSHPLFQSGNEYRLNNTWTIDLPAIKDYINDHYTGITATHSNPNTYIEITSDAAGQNSQFEVIVDLNDNPDSSREVVQGISEEITLLLTNSEVAVSSSDNGYDSGMTNYRVYVNLYSKHQGMWKTGYEDSLPWYYESGENTKPVFWNEGSELRLCESNFALNNPNYKLKYYDNLRSGFFGWDTLADLASQWDIWDPTGHLTKTGYYLEDNTRDWIFTYDDSQTAQNRYNGLRTYTSDIDYFFTASSYNDVANMGVQFTKVDDGDGIDWIGDCIFYAAAIFQDDGESIPAHTFQTSGSGNVMEFGDTLGVEDGHHLRIQIAVKPTNNGGDDYIFNRNVKGIHIYYTSSEEGHETFWSLGKVTWDSGFNKANEVFTPGFDTGLGQVYKWKLKGSGNSTIAYIQNQDGTPSDSTRAIDFYTMPKIDSFEKTNGFSPTKNYTTDIRYKTHCIAGRRSFVGNIAVKRIDGSYDYFNDRVVLSPANQLDTFPYPYGVLDLDISDGDEIVSLMSIGDKVVQFKKNIMYILNISSGIPSEFFVEERHKYKGISSKHHVVETEEGLFWVNKNGAYLYDGDKVNNLHYSGDDDEKERKITGADNTGRLDSSIFNHWKNIFERAGEDTEVFVIYNSSSMECIVGQDFEASNVLSGSSMIGGNVMIYSLNTKNWTYGEKRINNGYGNNMTNVISAGVESSTPLFITNTGHRSPNHLDGTKETR
tara:strand:- start:3473 stop:8749 length:5277 start_codon:yes stop_codon:yes gene_type:complete